MQLPPLINELKERIPNLEKQWKEIENLFFEVSYPSKTNLLNEGDVSQYLYFVKEGCLRLWFNDKGKDITFQFFFENEIVTSFESFRFGIPSLFTLETIEPVKLLKINKQDLMSIFIKFPDTKDHLIEFLFQRLSRYTHLFLSRIKESPEDRYRALIKMEPRIPNRIPQHYIASYLGISPVSLSRIRKRVWEQKN
ncbi:MAG: Crp/Fnr family transcriptional regulator [Leptospiraceae bacterium]|nr:Crp/Fnr family transcriptional regulator [Leptospiraceae bacterium]MBK9501094.1 Crp/Fnr family transcriptional regulator [Leptospiraceae bacterium]MBP9164860.1 Crp/Fnr family transcriptional regulator [Leptospiraceae bacterium]